MHQTHDSAHWVSRGWLALHPLNWHAHATSSCNQLARPLLMSPAAACRCKPLVNSWSKARLAGPCSLKRHMRELLLLLLRHMCGHAAVRSRCSAVTLVGVAARCAALRQTRCPRPHGGRRHGRGVCTTGYVATGGKIHLAFCHMWAGAPIGGAWAQNGPSIEQREIWAAGHALGLQGRRLQVPKSSWVSGLTLQSLPGPGRRPR